MPAGPQQQAQRPPVRFATLSPPGPEVELDGLLERLDLVSRSDSEARRRPYTLLNMVSTADGRATLEGRSGAIGDDGDKLLFHGLRTLVDAVMVGAGTLRAERYRRLVRDADALAARRARGLSEQPLACVVSGRLALDESIPLLADADSRVAVLTASQASLPAGCRARVEYVRDARDGQLDLPAAFAALRSRLGVRTLLCEGGPHLNAHLLAAGLVDELFLSLAPTLAGGDAMSESLRIVSGLDLDPPVAMRLLSAYEHGSHLFLRYAIAPGPEPRR
jgi:riboflavin biosynthesis pyrimidine reductase